MKRYRKATKKVTKKVTEKKSVKKHGSKFLHSHEYGQRQLPGKKATNVNKDALIEKAKEQARPPWLSLLRKSTFVENLRDRISSRPTLEASTKRRHGLSIAHEGGAGRWICLGPQDCTLSLAIRRMQSRVKK